MAQNSCVICSIRRQDQQGSFQGGHVFDIQGQSDRPRLGLGDNEACCPSPPLQMACSITASDCFLSSSSTTPREKDQNSKTGSVTGYHMGLRPPGNRCRPGVWGILWIFPSWHTLVGPLLIFLFGWDGPGSLFQWVKWMVGGL